MFIDSNRPISSTSRSSSIGTLACLLKSCAHLSVLTLIVPSKNALTYLFAPRNDVRQMFRQRRTLTRRRHSVDGTDPGGPCPFPARRMRIPACGRRAVGQPSESESLAPPGNLVYWLRHLVLSGPRSTRCDHTFRQRRSSLLPHFSDQPQQQLMHAAAARWRRLAENRRLSRQLICHILRPDRSENVPEREGEREIRTVWMVGVGEARDRRKE